MGRFESGRGSELTLQVPLRGFGARTSLVVALLLVSALLACRPGAGRGSKGTQRASFDARAVAANAKHTCLLQPNGLARCFGGDDTRNPPMTATPTVELKRIETGRRFACGLKAGDSTLICWGDCSARARCVAPAGAFDDFALDDDSGGCAWTNTPARVECWGGWLATHPPPSSLASTATARIVFGPDWGVAQRDDGTLLAWGRGAVVADPRLGRAVATGEKFRSIGGRGALLCLVDLSGKVECIVHHGNATPPRVSGAALFVDASSPRGALPACVLSDSGGTRTVHCSTTNKGRKLPVFTGKIDDLAVGDDHVCVHHAHHRVECVGDNMFGRVSGRSMFGSADWP